MFIRLANTIAHIKLGLKVKKYRVSCVYNKFIIQVLLKLINDGYISSFSYNRSKPYTIDISLKYNSNFRPVFRDIKLISSCGHRVFFSYLQVLDAYNNNQYFLLSTNKGLLSTNDIVLNKFKLGGEVILYINHY